MQTLITGGAGFIGSHVSEALLSRGDQVITAEFVEGVLIKYSISSR